LLEGVGADQVRVDLAGDRDERGRVHPRVGDRGHEVRRAGPGGRDRDARPAGRTGVALRHVAGALFVAGEHVPDRRAARDRVVGGQDRPAGDAEHHVDALGFEAAEDGVGAEHAGHGCTSWKCSVSVRTAGRCAITASVKERVSVVASSSAAETARSSVRAAERAPSPSPSRSEAARKVPAGSATPKPATSSASTTCAAKRPGPVGESQALATVWSEPARWAAASTIAPARWLPVTTRSTVPGWSRKRVSRPPSVRYSTSRPSQRSASAATSSPRTPLCTRETRQRRSRSALTPSKAGSAGEETKIASARRYASRVDGGSGWPRRVSASPPKGRWTSSRWKACRRATSVSTREVSAISSGPT